MGDNRRNRCWDNAQVCIIKHHVSPSHTPRHILCMQKTLSRARSPAKQNISLFLRLWKRTPVSDPSDHSLHGGMESAPPAHWIDSPTFITGWVWFLCQKKCKLWSRQTPTQQLDSAQRMARLIWAETVLIVMQGELANLAPTLIRFWNSLCPMKAVSKLWKELLTKPEKKQKRKKASGNKSETENSMKF